MQQGECLSEDCGCDEVIDSSEEMVGSMGSLMPDIEGPHHGRVAVGDARETWMRTCRESSLCLGLACDRRMRTAPIVACVSRGSYHPLYPTTVQAKVIDRRHLSSPQSLAICLLLLPRPAHFFRHFPTVLTAAISRRLAR